MKNLISNNSVTKVYDYIQRQLGTNLCNVESCARFFNIHPRTLQRELAALDCSFKQLLLEKRIEIAEHYLKNLRYPCGFNCYFGVQKPGCIHVSV